MTAELQTLDTLASKINAEHEQAERHALAALDHMKNAGDHLNEAKQVCPHGQWGPWLGNNCTVSERQAQKYMQLARRWPEIEAKAPHGADLSLNNVLALLTDNSQQHPRGVDGVHEILAGSKAAKALFKIKDKHLYRAKYSTFEEYCMKEHNLDGEGLRAVSEMQDPDNEVIINTALGLMVERDITWQGALDYMVTEFNRATT